MISFALLSLEDLSYATKIIYGVLHIINDSLLKKCVDIQLKLGIQNFLKAVSSYCSHLLSWHLFYFTNFPTQSESIVHGFVSSVASKLFLYTIIYIQN